MNYIGLERSTRGHRSREVGAEKTEQRKPRAPGCGNVLRHVTRICEFLVSSRRVPEALHVNPVDRFFGRVALRRRGYYLYLDTLALQRDGQTKEE